MFRTHHVRYADVIDKRIQAIQSATPLTTDEGVIAPNALLVQALVSQLRVTLQAIADFDNAIAQRAQRHPDFPLFAALPGAYGSLPPASSSPLGNSRNATPLPMHSNCAGLSRYTRTPTFSRAWKRERSARWKAAAARRC
jgi:hypothetical protein